MASNPTSGQRFLRLLRSAETIMPDGKVALEQMRKLGRVSRHQCITAPYPYLRVENTVHPSSHRVPFFPIAPMSKPPLQPWFPLLMFWVLWHCASPRSWEAKQGRRELLNDNCLSVNLWIWRRVFLVVRNGLQAACQEVQQRCWHLKAMHPDQVASWKIGWKEPEKMLNPACQ